MNESNIFGVSVRALIAYTLVVCVCVLCLMQKKVDEPLYTLVMVAVSFYLGKSSNQQGGLNASNSNVNSASISNDSASGQPKSNGII